MPTTRPRFQVTETPEVERALRLAAHVWPGVPRHELVNRLFGVAADRLGEVAEGAERERLRAVDLTAGAFDAVYGPGYLAALRSEWPE
ncbi:hypothetical protein ACDF64_07745 [Agromyces sp. MMS24-JH15]|uniref:hypothetical protein n=1 Tax=Agromyces sp. MMS24-JH15 TaxID=3243765 RepID=UPI003748CF5B